VRILAALVVLALTGVAAGAPAGDPCGVVTRKDIAVSTVAVPGADRSVLRHMADVGEGRHYAVDDVARLPRMFE
jgi:hypothetical protein